MKNDKPLLSIIVPVYRVEEYLDRCVESILRQKFSNYELILVNDGSDDKCPSMCEQWAQKDSRIKVVHKKNGGLSSARNAGVKVSCGKYIGFVDSDDWIENDMYSDLLEVIEKYDADVAQIDVQISKEYLPDEKSSCEGIELLEGEQIFKRFFRYDNPDIHYYAWDKLYKAEVVKGIEFWEGMLFEDIDYNFSVIQNINKIVFIKKKSYHWYFNEGSITRNGIKHTDMQLIEVWNKIVEQCRIKYPEYLYYAEMNRDRAYMGLLAKGSKYGVSITNDKWKEDKKILLNGVRKSYFDLLRWKMPINRKILLTLLCINPAIVSIPYRVLRR